MPRICQQPTIGRFQLLMQKQASLHVVLTSKVRQSDCSKYCGKYAFPLLILHSSHAIVGQHPKKSYTNWNTYFRQPGYWEVMAYSIQNLCNLMGGLGNTMKAQMLLPQILRVVKSWMRLTLHLFYYQVPFLHIPRYFLNGRPYLLRYYRRQIKQDFQSMRVICRQLLQEHLQANWRTLYCLR